MRNIFLKLIIILFLSSPLFGQFSNNGIQFSVGASYNNGTVVSLGCFYERQSIIQNTGYFRIGSHIGYHLETKQYIFLPDVEFGFHPCSIGITFPIWPNYSFTIFSCIPYTSFSFYDTMDLRLGYSFCIINKNKLITSWNPFYLDIQIFYPFPLLDDFFYGLGP